MSQCGGSSPVPRSFNSRKIERSPLYVADSVSKTTLENVALSEVETRALNITLALDDILIDTRPKFRKNARVLSTIASSSSTSDYPFQNILRESRSLDPFPLELYKRFESPNFSWKEPKKSFRSLENCDKCTRTNSKTNISGKVLNNNYPNGNVIIAPHTDGSPNEAETPLLGDESSCVGEVVPVKRWRSLDQVASVPSTDSVPDKKSSARNSIRSWLVNLFSGNGLRNSDVSLRRGVIAGYDIQSERESIV